MIGGELGSRGHRSVCLNGSIVQFAHALPRRVTYTQRAHDKRADVKRADAKRAQVERAHVKRGEVKPPIVERGHVKCVLRAGGRSEALGAAG
jgi:hypothetical protein